MPSTMRCICRRPFRAINVRWLLSVLIVVACQATSTLRSRGATPAATSTCSNARSSSAGATSTCRASRSAFLLSARCRTTFRSQPHRRGVPTRRGTHHRSRRHFLHRYTELLRMGARSGDGSYRGGPAGPRPKKRPLAFLCQAMNDAILEMCVENKGRPLAKSMTDFVEFSMEGLASGYSKEQLLLELQLLDSTTRVPGQTLTGVEKRYRTQWISALDFVMQNLKFIDEQEPKSVEEFHIKSQASVDVVMRGRQTNDEQTFVKFDKALATGGVAGGVATECIAISPQMVPLSQLVLLGIRALQKLEDAAEA
ncbi:unnamed protein product [Ectocarpus sp. 6 AP-2014]